MESRCFRCCDDAIVLLLFLSSFIRSFDRRTERARAQESKQASKLLFFHLLFLLFWPIEHFPLRRGQSDIKLSTDRGFFFFSPADIREFGKRDEIPKNFLKNSFKKLSLLLFLSDHTFCLLRQSPPLSFIIRYVEKESHFLSILLNSHMLSYLL